MQGDQLIIWKSLPINSRIQVKNYSEMICGVNLMELIRIGLFNYREVISMLINKLKSEGFI